MDYLSLVWARQVPPETLDLLLQTPAGQLVLVILVLMFIFFISGLGVVVMAMRQFGQQIENAREANTNNTNLLKELAVTNDAMKDQREELRDMASATTKLAEASLKRTEQHGELLRVISGVGDKVEALDSGLDLGLGSVRELVKATTTTTQTALEKRMDAGTERVIAAFGETIRSELSELRQWFLEVTAEDRRSRATMQEDIQKRWSESEQHILNALTEVEQIARAIATRTSTPVAVVTVTEAIPPADASTEDSAA